LPLRLAGERQVALNLGDVVGLAADITPAARGLE
jgi:hypothetical protein